MSKYTADELRKRLDGKPTPVWKVSCGNLLLIDLGVERVISEDEAFKLGAQVVKQAAIYTKLLWYDGVEPTKPIILSHLGESSDFLNLIGTTFYKIEQDVYTKFIVNEALRGDLLND